MSLDANVIEKTMSGDVVRKFAPGGGWVHGGWVKQAVDFDQPRVKVKLTFLIYIRKLTS